MRDITDPHEAYAAAKAIDGYPGRGTFPIAALRVVAFYGWWMRQFFYEPISTYDTLLGVAQENARLDESHTPSQYLNSIQVVFRMFDSIYSAPMGRVPLPGPGEVQKDVHAVGVYGWDDGGESLFFQNSWGARWGDKGCGLLSREYLNRYMTEAWVARRARWGLTRDKREWLNSARDAQEFSRIWLLDNPPWRGRFRYRGRGHQVHIYESLSYEYACIAEVVQIRTGTAGILAWAHLFLLPGQPRTTLVTEFYVWPWFRRQGYGTWLEEMVCYRSAVWRSRRIRVWFHNMDAQPRMRAAGRCFGEQRGYTWRWCTQARPKIEAIGEKPLEPSTSEYMDSLLQAVIHRSR